MEKTAKTCNLNGWCHYRLIGAGTAEWEAEWECGFAGHCAYQLPNDYKIQTIECYPSTWPMQPPTDKPREGDGR